MAFLFPSLSVINRLKVPATEGELYLCNFLTENLDDNFNIFFNPFLDGDRPDIIILKKGHGAVIIEVKDWNLDLYSINKSNRWSVNKVMIRSPFVQAFSYKANFFDLHLPTLGIKEALNKNFFKVITCYVYFHHGSNDSIRQKFNEPLYEINNEIQVNNCNYKNKPTNMDYDDYERKRLYLLNKKNNLNAQACRF